MLPYLPQQVSFCRKYSKIMLFTLLKELCQLRSIGVTDGGFVSQFAETIAVGNTNEQCPAPDKMLPFLPLQVIFCRKYSKIEKSPLANIISVTF